MDQSISFHKHCNYVSDRIDKRNNMLKALAGSSWGQDNETLLMTYNALGKSIANYAAPFWSTNASDSSFKKIQTAQNVALKTATGAHKMTRIDYCHQESFTLTTQTCSLRSTLWTVWRRNTSIMASQLKSQDLDQWRILSTLDITQLFFLARHKQNLHIQTWNTCSLATHTRRTCHLRIYGGSGGMDSSSAISTTGIATYLTTDLTMATTTNWGSTGRFGLFSIVAFPLMSSWCATWFPLPRNNICQYISSL